jgi:excisionase family DNA binding protein
MPKLDTYVTVAEAARRLRISRTRVYQLVEKGKLRARKRVPAVARISLADVEARLVPGKCLARLERKSAGAGAGGIL